jgi:hypothetical protein
MDYQKMIGHYERDGPPDTFRNMHDTEVHFIILFVPPPFPPLIRSFPHSLIPSFPPSLTINFILILNSDSTTSDVRKFCGSAPALRNHLQVHRIDPALLKQRETFPVGQWHGGRGSKVCGGVGGRNGKQLYAAARHVGIHQQIQKNH